MQPAQILSGIRLGVGVGAWATPDVTGKLFGLDPKTNPQMSYMARLFGVRDVALAIGTNATPAASRRLWWQIGIATDLMDVLAAVIGGRNGSIPKVTAVLAGGTALAAAGLGAAALSAETG